MANPTQIHQLIMNLITNAAHAMRLKGGVLEISLKSEVLDELTTTHMRPPVAPGPFFEINGERFGSRHGSRHAGEDL